jgi:putative spermidine/putrescine transport system substrate-binding protein
MKKLFTISLLLILLIVVSSSVVFAKETLVVQSAGGTFEEAQRKIMVEDFEKENNCTVLIETLLSAQAISKLRVEKDNPILAVAFQDEVIAIQALEEGLYGTLDVSKLTNFKDVDAKFKVDNNKYVGWFFANEVIAYNSDYVKEPPKSWEDLWDPKYKGKILLPDITTSHGISLLVIWSRLNGGSEKNIDPGFEKLASIKPNVLTFWTNHDQVARMLNTGEAWIAVWASDRAYTQEMLGSPIRSVIPEEGTFYWRCMAGIPDKLKNKDLAYKWLDKLLSPEVQKYMTEHVFTSPVNSTVSLDLPPALAEKMMGESTKSKLITMDLIEINKHKEEWMERFRREITQ